LDVRRRDLTETGQLRNGKRHNLQSSSDINYSNYNDQMKEDEMGGGWNRRAHENFGKEF
jgi:hypothetical protein